DVYPTLDYSLNIRRKSRFYFHNLLLPCILISMLSPFVFLLPADSGEKVSLGVTILLWPRQPLSLTVFQLLVAEQMPPSEQIPIIGEFYLYTMALVSFSVLITIFILGLHHGPSDPPPGFLTPSLTHLDVFSVPNWLFTITKLNFVKAISQKRRSRREFSSGAPQSKLEAPPHQRYVEKDEAVNQFANHSFG
ncbi:unnamed protein product, partial [Oikopleura dioica]